MKNVDKVVKERLEIKFTYVDLFYAYCQAKGIDDPECDVESDEEYEALEKEFESKITYEIIAKLGEEIIHDGMKRINCAMDELARR